MRRRIIRGLIAQAVSLLVLYFSVEWLYAIGWLAILVVAIPIYVVSVFRLMKSGAPIWVRLVLSFWPLIIPLLIEAYGWTIDALQWRMVRTEVFLIPAEYRGRITVMFDDPQGTAPVREGGRAVFSIPANGELHTRDHSPWMHLAAVNQAIDDRREFYLVDKSGGRVRIFPQHEGQPAEEPAVSWGRSYANFVPVGGVLEESRYQFYDFSAGSAAERRGWR